MILKVAPCAFHNDELITNFCRSPECLLPMCPKCIRLHSEEHTSANTQPTFETIAAVVKEVERQYLHAEKLFERAGEELLQVQTYKKKNEQLVRKRLLDAREKLVREFERQLIELEEDLIRRVICYGEEVVTELRNLDEQIDLQIASIENSLNELYSDKCLRNVINFFSMDYPSGSTADLEAVSQRIQRLGREGLHLDVRDAQLSAIGHALKDYMSLRVAKTTDTQPRDQPTAGKTPPPKFRSGDSFS